jgi:hypothetical protein
MSNPNAEAAYKLPVQPLVNPLNENDLAGLTDLKGRLLIAQDMVARAAGLVHDIESRIDKCAMHFQVHATLMERYFPDQLPTTQQ